MTEDAPVLTFITSLRHPHNSSDYRRTEQLAVRTLHSLAAQTDTRCRVVVVANRPLAVPPDLGITVEQVVVDYPPPSVERGPRTGIPAVLLDKGSKLAVGASRVGDGHVMFVDADDYVSARVTAHVAAEPTAAGWYVDQGLMYDWHTGLVDDVDHFNTVCGTSLIVRRDLLPDVGDPDLADRDALVDHLGRAVVFEQFGSHRHLAERFSLAPLPFAGAAYSVNTGDNHSGKQLHAAGRPVTRPEAAEFGLDLRPFPARFAARSTRRARRPVGRALRRVRHVISEHRPRGGAA